MHFTLDALGNITAEGDASGVPTPNESYQYDPLYRLQEVDDATGAPWQSYTYDKTGDRLSKTTTAQTPADTYSYTPGTHHLIGISGYDASSRAVNPNGNTSAFQANGWMYGLGYNDTNRLSLVQQNGVTVAAYRLDGKGERVRKLLSGATPTEYVYDEAGRLLYEYSGPSQNRSYIWADNTLVAAVEDNSTLHYVYTDHLGTPRAITTTASDTPIWTWPWLQNPFGEKPASGAGGYTFNLRYPGQYYDAETGLSYNYFRDYEPNTGRYGESDPLGLFGSQISTYAYAGGSPEAYVDPFGLYTCTYIVDAHDMTCLPDNPGDPSFNSSDFTSGGHGMNSCINNPACEGIPDHGPIPDGWYGIHGNKNPPDKPPRLPLVPLPGTDTGGRGGFQIHGCANAETCSEGCVAATTNKVRDEIAKLLASEPNNRLYVTHDGYVPFDGDLGQ